MKEMVRYGFTLALICVVASAALAWVNSTTKLKILAQLQAEEVASQKEVVPEGVNFEPIKSKDEIIYYKAFDKEGKFTAVVFKAAQKGYSSNLETMVGMTKDGKIIAIKILSHNETPGIGAKVAGDDFIGRFSNKNIEDLDEVQAITGATISSKAVIDAVQKKAEEIKALIKDER